MRKQKTTAVTKTPIQDKFSIDVDVAITTALEAGLSRAEVIEAMLMQAEIQCQLASEKGEDLTSLAGMLAL